jgi:hypothetical protein
MIQNHGHQWTQLMQRKDYAHYMLVEVIHEPMVSSSILGLDIRKANHVATVVVGKSI